MEDSNHTELLRIKNIIINEAIDFIDTTCTKFNVSADIVQIAMFDVAVSSMAVSLHCIKEPKNHIDKMHRELIVFLNHRFKEIEERYEQNTPSVSPAPADTPK